MKLTKYILILSLFLPLFSLGQETPLEGITIKDLKIEINHKMNGGMKVGNPFNIYCIVTKESGGVEVEYVKHEDDNDSYDVTIEGAELEDGVLYYYHPFEYCEEYTDKELTITVTAKGTNSVTKTLVFVMDCTPDPAILAQKQKEEQEELQRIEAAKQKEAQVKAEKANLAKLATAGNQVGLTIPPNTVTSVKFIENDQHLGLTYSEFLKQTDVIASFLHVNTVEIDNELLFLGSVRKAIEDKRTYPAIYKMKGDKLVPLEINIGDFPLFANTSIRDAVKISDNEILVVGDNGFMKMEKTANGYKNILHLSPPEDFPLHFTDLVLLGNNKCASLGYTRKMGPRKPNYIIRRDISNYEYQTYDDYKIYRDQGIDWSDYCNPDTRHDSPAYLIIWDYIADAGEVLHLDNDVSEEAVLACDKNGHLIISYGQYSENHFSYPSDYLNLITYKSENNYICSIDISKTLENKNIHFNWTKNVDVWKTDDDYITFVISDLVIEDNGDIVFTGVSHRDTVVNYYKKTNNGYSKYYSSAVGIGRLSANGDVKKFRRTSQLNLSYWGGSKSGNLSTELNPGKIYYSPSRYPKLLATPDGKGYIMRNTISYDKVTYPDGYANSSESEEYAKNQLLVYIGKESLLPVSFDLIGFPESGKFITDYLTYNANTKKYTLIKSKSYEFRSSYKIEFTPKFDNTWTRGLSLPETIAERNHIKEYLKGNIGREEGSSDESESDNYSAGNSSSSSSSNDSNNSSSSSSNSNEIEMVKVSINTNGKGDAWVYIHWTVDGQNKKHTFAHNTSGSIGMIPAGTDLYYATEQTHSNSKRTLFYTVPEGKSSVSVKLD